MSHADFNIYYSDCYNPIVSFAFTMLHLASRKPTAAMSLQDLPAELVERVVVLLPLSDTCSLRLTNRHLASNATQKHFKARFQKKRVQITEQQLSSFVAVTTSGSLACLLQDLTLVAPVYNTLEMASRLMKEAVCFVELSDEGRDVTLCSRDLTEEELRQAEIDLSVLQERLTTQLDMIHRQRDVQLLSQALSNLAAHGVSLRTLQIEVEIYKDDTTTPLLPLFGGRWKPIWSSAANASNTLFNSLAACDLPIHNLDLFNSTRMLRCSISCSELNSIDFAPARFGGSLGHLTELSLRVSNHIIDRNSDEEILRELAPGFDFTGLRSLLRTCPNIEKLDLTHFRLRYPKDANALRPGILHALAESKFPCLQTLTLQGFRTTGDELLTLLQRFKTLRSLSLRYIMIIQGSFRPILDYCTVNANMEEVNLESLFETAMIEFEFPWVIQPIEPTPSGSPPAILPNSRAAYRRGSDNAASHRIEYRKCDGHTLDAPYFRAWRQDLRNRFGPLTEKGKSSCLQPYVSPEQTWRHMKRL